MVMGIAMVKVAPRRRDRSITNHKEKEDILDLFPVSGKYDFFILVQAESFANLNRLIADIQKSHRPIKARTSWQTYDQ